MLTNEQMAQIESYILESIDSSGYGRDLEGKSAAEKLQFVSGTFSAEYGWRIARFGRQKALAEWLAGLPSAINIEYRNSEILKLAESWSELPANASDSRCCDYLESWFTRMAFRILQLARKHGVNFEKESEKCKR